MYWVMGDQPSYGRARVTLTFSSLIATATTFGVPGTLWQSREGCIFGQHMLHGGGP